MKQLDERLDQVHALIETIGAKRDQIVSTAVKDTGFTHRECNMEVDIVLERLQSFDEMQPVFAKRRPLCKPQQHVALVLPYNGSAWLNTTIMSIYLVGNCVRVKFASRDSGIARLTESIYQPIFGTAIDFDYADGRTFLERAVTDPDVPAICLFGTDRNAWPYREAIRRQRKKFVFEGPGKDPFIVLAGADLEAAARELAFSKYLYAGQTCTAPERVYLNKSVADAFLEIFLSLSRRVKIGDPQDPKTEMGPVASRLAVENIQRQLKDATARGAKILLGGRIERNLVYPTVVVNATHDMLGMQEETFGPVVFIATFETAEEAVALARDNRYGLRATVYGPADEAEKVGQALVGRPYCHPVDEMLFGKFGTLAVNQGRSQSWRGALVFKPIGGYGRSGWIWETCDDRFILKQGPKLLSLETSIEKSV